MQHPRFDWVAVGSFAILRCPVAERKELHSND